MNFDSISPQISVVMKVLNDTQFSLASNNCVLTLQRHLIEQNVVSCRDLLENWGKLDVEEATL